MNAKQLEQLEKIGNRWQQHGYDRIYFKNEFVYEMIGLSVGYYHSGNISSASQNGERISNSRARRIMSTVGKIFYDVNAEKFDQQYGNDDYLVLSDFVEAITKLIELS